MHFHQTPDSLPGESSLLLVLPPLGARTANGERLFERQAANGLDRWADNFGRVLVACGFRDIGESGHGTVEYVPLNTLKNRTRIDFVDLPIAYSLARHVRYYRSTRALLGQLSLVNRYRCFAVGGLFGDWGALASFESASRGLSYSVWTDRVEPSIALLSYQEASGLRRAYRWLKARLFSAPLMRVSEQRAIRGSHLGLFHGHDCFSAYKSFSRNPQLVHDIHLRAADRITPDRLKAKCVRLGQESKLRIVYTGRAAAMKGPIDWLQAMAILRRRGIRFEASWLGDGPLLDAMRNEVNRLDLADCVRLLGYVSDRATVMESLRDADIFAFCHKTPESPRCLIEALMSGTPIIGYNSPYARDLLGARASECLVPHDPLQLANVIERLNHQRESLTRLCQAASEIGAKFSDEAVFRHRSDLIKQFLG